MFRTLVSFSPFNRTNVDTRKKTKPTIPLDGEFEEIFHLDIPDRLSEIQALRQFMLNKGLVPENNLSQFLQEGLPDIPRAHVLPVFPKETKQSVPPVNRRELNENRSLLYALETEIASGRFLSRKESRATIPSQNFLYFHNSALLKPLPTLRKASSSDNLNLKHPDSQEEFSDFLTERAKILSLEQLDKSRFSMGTAVKSGEKTFEDFLQARKKTTLQEMKEFLEGCVDTESEDEGFIPVRHQQAPKSEDAFSIRKVKSSTNLSIGNPTQGKNDLVKKRKLKQRVNSELREAKIQLDRLYSEKLASKDLDFFSEFKNFVSVPVLGAHKQIKPQGNYETNFALIKACLESIQTRGTHPYIERSKKTRINQINTAIDGQLFNWNRILASSVTRLGKLPIGTLVGGSFRDLSIQKAFETIETFLRGAVIADAGREALELHYAIKQIIIDPFLPNIPKKHQEWANTLMNQIQVSLNNEQSPSWEKLKEMYKAVLTILFVQKDLPLPELYTGDKTEIGKRQARLQLTLSSLLPTWTNAQRERLVNAYSKAEFENYDDLGAIRVKGELSDLKSLLKKEVLQKQPYNSPVYSRTKDRKVIGAKLAVEVERYFKKINSHLSHSLGKVNIVERQRKTIKNKKNYSPQEKKIINLLINLYVSGASLDPYYWSRRQNLKLSPQEKVSIEKTLLALKFYSENTDVFQDIHQSFASIRTEVLAKKEKFRQIEELVSTYPERIRPQLRKIAQNIVEGKRVRAILNGGSGTGKSHFVKEACKIAGVKFHPLELTQGFMDGTKPTDLIKPAPDKANPLDSPDTALDKKVGLLGELLLHQPKNLVVFADEGLGALLGNSTLLSFMKQFLDVAATKIRTAIGLEVDTSEMSFIVNGNEDIENLVKKAWNPGIKKNIMAILGRFAPYYVEFSETDAKMTEKLMNAKVESLLGDTTEEEIEIKKELNEYYKPRILTLLASSEDAQGVGMRLCTGESFDLLVAHMLHLRTNNPDQKIDSPERREETLKFIKRVLIDIISNPNIFNEETPRQKALITQLEARFAEFEMEMADSSEFTYPDEETKKKTIEAVKSTFDKDVKSYLLDELLPWADKMHEIKTKSFTEGDDFKAILAHIHKEAKTKVEEQVKNGGGDGESVVDPVQEEVRQNKLRNLVQQKFLPFIVAEIEAAGKKL